MKKKKELYLFTIFLIGIISMVPMRALAAPMFDEAYYLNAKLKQLQLTGTTDAAGNQYTLETLKVAIKDAGMTPEQHYEQYGRSEKLNPNAYFNEAEYLAAKLAALQSNADTNAAWANKTTADLAKVIADAGMSPAEHYEQYGAFETKADGTLLNPSNALDANAYYAAKLQQMITKGEHLIGSKDEKLTVTDVMKNFQDAGLNPVSHYMQYGAVEAAKSGIPLVQTVAQGQRVPNDPGRNETGEYVPANYGPASLGPANAMAQAPPNPWDVGGRVPESLSSLGFSTISSLVPGDEGYSQSVHQAWTNFENAMVQTRQADVERAAAERRNSIARDYVNGVNTQNVNNNIADDIKPPADR